MVEILLILIVYGSAHPRVLRSFPTRRSSDLHYRHRRIELPQEICKVVGIRWLEQPLSRAARLEPHQRRQRRIGGQRSEEHTSELQLRRDLVCRLLLEKKNGCKWHTRSQRCYD